MTSPPGYNTSTDGVKGSTMRRVPLRTIPSTPINGSGGASGKTRNGAPAAGSTPLGTRRVPRK
jgi:hypothetical protein